MSTRKAAVLVRWEEIPLWREPRNGKESLNGLPLVAGTFSAWAGACCVPWVHASEVVTYH